MRVLIVHMRVLHTTARWPNSTYEAISPGRKTYFASNEIIIYLRKTSWLGRSHVWLASSVDCRRKGQRFSAVLGAVAYAENFHGGGFIQWHRVVICIWCALFVTSQIHVIVLFPNQRFSEVRWHNMHVFLNIHSPYFMCHCTEYNLLAVQVRLSEENTPNATIHSS